MTASTTTIAARLEALIGAPQVFAEPADCSRYAIDGVSPSFVVRPGTPEEVAALVRCACAEKLAVIPCGARTKLAIGMPPSRYDLALDLTRLEQIVHYDAADLTLSVEAGMPIAKLNAVLLEHKQFLPLLVPFYSQSTVGGTIASGIDSPLRQFYGTARDFVIGAEFVTGEGALAKSGGRVVKNVTGYDLHKLLIGSLGTLGILTRINFRTFPAPPASCGFIASFPAAAGGLDLRRMIGESPLTPLTLDVLSPELAQLFATRAPSAPEPALFSGENQNAAAATLPPPGDWFHPREWQVCAAFGGTSEVLDRYARDLSCLAQDCGATSTAVLDDSTRPVIWGRLRECLSMLLDASAVPAIFKLSLLPAQHAAAIAKLQDIAARASLPHALIARAVGTIYFALLPPSQNDDTSARLARAAEAVFELAASCSGHATLLFAPAALKRRVSIWGRARPDLPLMRRVKNVFDPGAVLAPGRIAEGY